ncbi:hypothetical protein EZS27_004649 [termite gut metagenome]|uniref:Uncharacterized protein n=1 Tax=termite gut metagenome TaxID=433724 RepID=A0A5J4SNR7_9ZZZZ
MVVSCGKKPIPVPEKDTNLGKQTEVIYHASYSGGYILGLSQSLNNIVIDNNIKYLTVYVGFNVNEYGGAFGSFQIYLENLLETDIPTYGVITPHRTKDIKTSFYYASFNPSIIIDDKSLKRVTLKVSEIWYRDGAIYHTKIGVPDYGITKVIGHY